MEEKLKQIIDRFNELESLLADPKVISDNVRLKETAKEHTQINLVIPKANRYLVLVNEIEENKLLLKSDDEELKSLAAEEISQMEEELNELEDKLKILLIPQDPNDE